MEPGLNWGFFNYETMHVDACICEYHVECAAQPRPDLLGDSGGSKCEDVNSEAKGDEVDANE